MILFMTLIDLEVPRYEAFRSTLVRREAIFEGANTVFGKSSPRYA